jgi:signal transduction histidine kinase
MIQPGGDISEIRRLMDEFNRATGKLSESYRQITELQLELAEKDRKLSQKTRLEMLGHMAANLAHEIRNPLGGIQLYASMLVRDLQGDEEKVRTVERILAAVSGLNNLVEDMLTFGNDVEPRRVPARLGRIVESAIELAETTIRENRIEVERAFDNDPLSVDPEMIQRAFLNLILNSAQAMPSGGTLTIEGDAAELRFRDTGPGIPDEFVEKLFTPFVTSKTKGTGLGLAIARKNVELHGGTIEAANLPEGGAVFVIRL